MQTIERQQEQRSRREPAPRAHAARQTEAARDRPWASAGRLLDERAYLLAFGRGGAQRMATPLQAG